MTILIKDTRQVGAVSRASIPFRVSRGQLGVLRSTNLDGSAVISVYYDAPDESIGHRATFDDQSPLTLTPANPERMINVPGVYRVAVTGAATTQGIVFVDII
jgi:hypothetical protein